MAKLARSGVGRRRALGEYLVRVMKGCRDKDLVRWNGKVAVALGAKGLAQVREDALGRMGRLGSAAQRKLGKLLGP